MNFLHRRSRSASATRPQTPASASAHMAATQAFLSSRASQANLSASAAAQALRTMSPTPTPVDQVQTKRMIQRQASSGSLSSSARGRGRGGLQRQNSAGSMTERTFRTPSPSPSRPVSRSEPQAPPLPTIPQHFTPPSTTSVKKKKKRASSQDAPPPRVLSPPLVRPQTRGQSLDRYGSPQQPTPLPPSNFQRNISIPQSNDLERVDSRNSINFSRPLSPRPQSPVAQSPMAQSPVLVNGDRPHPNAVARAISPAQAADIQYDLAQTASQPVKRKKKKVVNGAAEGSHLQGGTMASRPVVNALEANPEPQIQSSSDQQPVVKKKKKKPAISGESTDFPATDTSRTDSDSDSNVERKRERRTQRASGVLQKQPSIVREDWEGEQQEQASPPRARQTTDANLNSVQEATSLVQDKRPTTATKASSQIESAIPPTPPTQSRSPESHAIAATDGREESPASMSRLQVTEPQPIRGTSLSPSRSTRFSDRLSSDLAAGRKHEPPPRSISPAKPALKHHSPAPVLAGSEPRGSSVTPSESSDISSASADGPPKRKKSVRVSFEVQPEIVGTAAGVQSPAESPGKEKKGWLGLGKGKPMLNTVSSNDDMEELMKPRPQLPSFGSVRGQKFRDINDSNTAQIPRSLPETRALPIEGKSSTTSGTSSETSSTYTPYPATGVSSDHAVGAIFAQEARKTFEQTSEHRPNEPLPPEVTSVEGTVSFSDEENDTSEAEETAHPQTPSRVVRKIDIPTDAKTTPATSINQPVKSAVEQPLQTGVPVVSVSPPTPAEELKPNDQYLVEVPGGFPVSAETLGKRDEISKETSLASRLPNVGLRAVAEAMNEDESDNDSIYSDAAEDPSEMEGMGFGSIDAIVESPIVTPSAPFTSQESPPAPVSSSASHDALGTGSWEETQARWSGIAEQTRYLPSHYTTESQTAPASAIHDVEQARQAPEQQAVQRGTPEAATTVYNKISQPAQPRPTRPPTSQPKRKKKSPAAIAAAASIPAAAAATQGFPDSPLQKKNQRSAYPTIEGPDLGYAAAAVAPFRQSMRASSPPETEPGFRKTMRNENRSSMPASTALPPQQRTNQPRSALQNKYNPSAAAAAISAPATRTQPVRPILSNDSDSESSFRKARRSKSTTGGKYTMRQSMRGSAEPTLRGDRLSGVRSVSPVGRRPFSSDGSHSLRTTMRASIDNVPTLRGSTDVRRSSSLFGRQQTTGAPALSMRMGGQNNRSRILDSEEEDEQPQRSKWRSRFADDSDDETDVPQFAPVRGIPRRNNDDESTDLDDSSDEERAAARSQRAPKLQIPYSDAAAPPSTAEALSPSSEKKRGILGIFRSKKPKEEGLSPVVESPQILARATDTTKGSRLGFASTAERDRAIERTRAKLEAANEQQNLGGSQHGHAKLHRRHGPERIMSDSWPLPPAFPTERARPSTADGPPIRNGTTRLNQGSMRKTNEVSDAVGRSGKKKKFPLLRKAFGLKD